MRSISLSPRLLALAHQVPQGARFADVGTDHGRLPVWLLEHGTIERAVVTDLREGPLQHARQTAQRHGLTESISFRLGDGLRPLGRGEVDHCAIAGMGGETIVNILRAAPWVKDAACRFLLQPMSAIPDLRAWLWRNGFRIEREELIEEGETIYVLITAVPGKMVPLTRAEEWAGRQIRGMEAPLRGSYLARLTRRVDDILKGLRRSTRPADLTALTEWESLAAELQTLREEWESWQSR